MCENFVCGRKYIPMSLNLSNVSAQSTFQTEQEKEVECYRQGHGQQKH